MSELAATGQAAAASWEGTVERIDSERRQTLTELKRAQKGLRHSAEEAGEIELLNRLWLQPQARGYGYARLPKITEDPGPKRVPPSRTRYSLAEVERWSKSLHTDADALAKEVEAEPGTELTGLVADFESLRERYTMVLRNVDYHRRWQQSVVDYPEFFAANNQTVAEIEAWQAEVEEKGTSEVTDRRLRDITSNLARFTPTPGLELASRRGTLVLTVLVHSDITDTEFLGRFEAIVESLYSDSAAAREHDFVLEIEFERVLASTLYPEGPPKRDEPIDLDDHLARFPADALVLTTGAERTRAWVGRYVQLGPEDSSPRSLAHEFGHLLGFRDAYVRGFAGDISGPYGVELVEWTGLQQDLMGAADHGRVSSEMIDRLIEAYRPRGG